jgi:NAD(P)-dependent dehydrogenase (short-subunit alcohol dehydrogenase family)
MNTVPFEKIVLVTGSSRGLGFHIARYFSERGARVIMNGRDKNKLNVAVNCLGENVIGLAADVSQPEGAKNLVDFVSKKYGRLDTVVCNVGSGSSVQPGKESYAEWQRVFSKNFFSTTNVVEAAKDLLAKTKGSIICISSICGSQIIANAPVTYSCSKSALNTFVRGIARPLGKMNVRINAIEPGNLLFTGSVWEKKIKAEPKQIQKFIDDNVSLGRLGHPDEIAALVEFLSSEHAQFTTGSIFKVDGGQSVA